MIFRGRTPAIPGPAGAAARPKASSDALAAGPRVPGVWDLPALPKLNHANPAVREYIYGVAERWIRFGIDGWRLDVPEEIREPGFWEEFRRRVLAINPEAYIVGEIWNPAPEWLAGDRFHAVMNYPLAEAVVFSFAGRGRLDEALVAKTPNHRPNGSIHRRARVRAAAGGRHDHVPA